MKKIILLFFAVLLTSAIFAQEPLTQQDSTKIKLTKEVIYNDAKAALKQLGDALKVGAEHVYMVLVKQQVVNAIAWSVPFVVGILLLLQFAYSFTHADWREYGWNRHATLALFTIAFSLISLGVGLGHLDIIITGFVNPEYGAIKEIMDMIKGARP